MSNRFLDQLVPQSDASFRFRPPLIEPDVRLSRIRLSDKTSGEWGHQENGVRPSLVVSELPLDASQRPVERRGRKEWGQS